MNRVRLKNGCSLMADLWGLTVHCALYILDMCVYKGTSHKQGESWDDGCTYTCTCVDAMKGLYTCTSK